MSFDDLSDIIDEAVYQDEISPSSGWQHAGVGIQTQAQAMDATVRAMASSSDAAVRAISSSIAGVLVERETDQRDQRSDSRSASRPTHWLNKRFSAARFAGPRESA